MFHFGKWLRQQVDSKKLSVRQFAASIPASRQTVASWFEQESPPIQSHKRAQLAAALETSKQRIDFLIDIAGKKHVDEDFALQKAELMHEYAEGLAAGTPEGAHDANMAMKALLGTRIRSVPLYRRALAAGHWTEPIALHGDNPDGTIPCVPVGVERPDRLFAVQISGTSMETKYPNQSIIFFYLLVKGKDTLKVGLDYYVHRNNNEATFKQLVELRDGGETLRFRARNASKIKGFLDVAWDEIVRIAVAKGMYIDVSDSGD